jgi:hypothetical protein
MTWQELDHDNCKLPTLQECKKVRTNTGCIWKCGDSAAGCGRLWLLLLNKGVWVEVVKIESYEPLDNHVQISDVEDPDEEREREREAERERREIEKQAQYEIARKAEEQYQEYHREQARRAQERAAFEQSQKPSWQRKLGL